jgi:hypothetical protein
LALLQLHLSTCLHQVCIYSGLQADTLGDRFPFLSRVLFCMSHHSCEHACDVVAPPYVILVACVLLCLVFLPLHFHHSPLCLLQCSLRLHHFCNLSDGSG